MTYHTISFKEISYTFIRDVTNFYEVITQNLIGNYVASHIRFHSAVPHFLTDRDLLHVLVGVFTCNSNTI
jgi:hypothetical protein